MKVPLILAALTATAMVMGVSAQPSSGRSPDPRQLPKGLGPDLGRPTRQDDALPLLDFDQFIGKWTFEWDVPDGPLGPGGTIVGTTTYKSVGGEFYEADTDATGPEGRFTVHEAIGYLKDRKAMARTVTDSRGLSYLQTASVGGDLGGSYTIYYESAPFTYQHRIVRLKQTIRLVSPVSYRVATTVSVDGGPFVNYGTPRWQKQSQGGRGR